MEVKINSKTENKLFDRIEVNATLSKYTSTPSRKEVEQALCNELKCPVGALVINEILQPFGTKTATVNARVYVSPEQAGKMEPKYKFQRGKPKEKPVEAK
ncbi:MAG: hypothetical protein V1722_04305 [Candidatus Micrarchaeota archaeon]